MRMTISIPAAMKDAANHTFVLLGKAASLESLTDPHWTGADGKPCFLTSGDWSAAQIDGVLEPAVLNMLVADGRVPDVVDLALVSRAQAAFVLLEAAEEGAYPAPDPAKICAVLHDDPKLALAILGVTPVPAEE